jgi:serine/threonine protein phosphatase 1
MDDRWPINEERFADNLDSANDDDYYIQWMMSLLRYHVEGKTIFVHAGVDEEAEDDWEWGTDDYTFTEKYPAQTGRFHADWKIVAGHISTAEISGDPDYHDIYYDGRAHYYIDGTVLSSRRIPVLKVDTESDKYYRVTETGAWLILPYDEEN